MDKTDLSKKYKQFAQMYSESIEAEKNMHNYRRLVNNLIQEIGSIPNSGCFAVDISAHAFRQIAERLEELALEFPQIHEDVFKDGCECLLIPSNLKSFIYTAIAEANEKGNLNEQASRSNSGGIEFHYNVELEKWADDTRSLKFVIIVENGVVKTGYFNWSY